MRQQKTKDTEPERELRRALRARGFSGYRKQASVLPGLRRTVDLAFIGARVAVDVRGCFWHGCPDHSRRGTANADWWDAKLATNVKRDLDTEKRLTEAGWEVIVVWEHDDADEAAQRIAEAVNRRRRPVKSPSSHALPPEQREQALAAWQRLYGR
jgi:DNA mismatch endonuclease (patch repair protein)